MLKEILEKNIFLTTEISLPRHKITLTIKTLKFDYVKIQNVCSDGTIKKLKRQPQIERKYMSYNYFVEFLIQYIKHSCYICC